MAESYSDTTVFDCQVKACKQFFQDGLPPSEFNLVAEEDRPDNMKRFKGPVYDITGFDAQQVVSVLSDIVNDRDQFTFNKTFYLLIHSGNLQQSMKGEFEELFKLQAKPPATKKEAHQPGNGIVFVRPRGRTLFKRDGAKSYEELNGALEAYYDTKDSEGRLIFSDTTAFATHIKQLFKNNAQDQNIPQATFEAYMILLFEIARRLVKLDNPTKRKEELDILPIGSAIARIVKLLELRKCSFKDVLLPGHKFHCFSKGPEVRRTAIEEINNAILDIIKESTASFVVHMPYASHLHHRLLSTPSTQATAEQRRTKEQLKELQEMFCSEERLAKMFFSEEEKLAAELKNLTTRISSQRRSWSVTERTTAFDHCK